MGNKMAESSFKLSPKLKKELPKNEQEDAEKSLLKKSGGKCELCNNALGTDSKQIVCDHMVPSVDYGPTKLSNLYLAHRSCNASRQHLPFVIAKPIIEFKAFCEHKGEVTFDHVLNRYVPERNGSCTLKRRGDQISLSYKSWTSKATVMRDPATKVEFFFIELPVSVIRNDTEVQPRLIMHTHVRKLYLDFAERPVHEPSNCRLVHSQNDVVQLLQFDGQHKTTAQILLGRKTIVAKIYINPDIAMLQQLVIKIQQEIKKQPLTRSDTLAKLGDVITSYLEDYQVPSGQHRSERGLIESQSSKKTQTELRKIYFEELKRLIFFDEQNSLARAVRPGVSPAPTTDKVMINKIVEPLVFNELLDIDMDAAGGRDRERSMIVSIMNKIHDEMLKPGWDEKSSMQYKRVDTFFKQGAITWWMKEILIPSIRYATKRLGEKKPLFIDAVTDNEQSHIDSLIETLCNWDVWSTDDPGELAALRSNTVKNVIKAFGTRYDDKKLINQAIE
jgi:hypothetical protein